MLGAIERQADSGDKTFAALQKKIWSPAALKEEMKRFSRAHKSLGEISTQCRVTASAVGSRVLMGCWLVESPVIPDATNREPRVRDCRLNQYILDFTRRYNVLPTGYRGSTALDVETIRALPAGALASHATAQASHRDGLLPFRTKHHRY